MTNVRITGMHRTKGAPNKAGTRIVSFFDLDLPDLTLRGCALALKPDGTWIAWTPRLPDDDGTARRACYFRGSSLQREVTALALELYRQLGGNVDLETAARAA
jgi:hypothetical protein